MLTKPGRTARVLQGQSCDPALPFCLLFCRIARAAAVLLSDPCFQLHSIQHLLGEGVASGGGANHKHFSLHASSELRSRPHPEPHAPLFSGFIAVRRTNLVFNTPQGSPVPRGAEDLRGQSVLSPLLPSCAFPTCCFGRRYLGLLASPVGWLLGLLSKARDHWKDALATGTGTAWVGMGMETRVKEEDADADYISAEEEQKVEQMLALLTEESKQAAATTAANFFFSNQPTSEDDLCPICYAHSISAVFKPCSHKSCKLRHAIAKPGWLAGGEKGRRMMG
ncbi:hypothetical protein P4O66_006236 [Electrophorus voltai]|uniref:Uncharacterized protein n=1 Tax=Electrophorus voltai TaxID=2609070 RepID=A0AAD9DZE2_9TELE|nr:hypothetical protein P4O66_006236 [Electrophorus voltai]